MSNKGAPEDKRPKSFERIWNLAIQGNLQDNLGPIIMFENPKIDKGSPLILSMRNCISKRQRRHKYDGMGLPQGDYKSKSGLGDANLSKNFTEQWMARGVKIRLEHPRNP
ncbi:MAG: hypothetical protein H5T36_01685 [Methanobacteriaceae archaeon]|nr:hypothetical protein [Methanobacteriaceae archaeon]